MPQTKRTKRKLGTRRTRRKLGTKRTRRHCGGVGGVSSTNLSNQLIKDIKELFDMSWNELDITDEDCKKTFNHPHVINRMNRSEPPYDGYDGEDINIEGSYEETKRIKKKNLKIQKKCNKHIESVYKDFNRQLDKTIEDLLSFCDVVEHKLNTSSDQPKLKALLTSVISALNAPSINENSLMYIFSNGGNRYHEPPYKKIIKKIMIFYRNRNRIYKSFDLLPPLYDVSAMESTTDPDLPLSPVYPPLSPPAYARPSTVHAQSPPPRTIHVRPPTVHALSPPPYSV